MEDKTPSIVVSVTCWSRTGPKTKIMKTAYFIKDSTKMRLVTCLRVLNTKSIDLP